MSSESPDMQSEPSWRDGVTVRGARQNNLKNVALDLPRDAIVAFTGVSGSGKSSLAFGTLYAESQRRYLESVAPYARRLIDQAGVPDVDVVEGLPPAVALQQQRGGGGARSDVATVTTLSSLVRMLYSRAGWYPDGQPMLYAEDFSANTVEGACPTCHGIGRVYEVTEDLMVPDPDLTIRERAVASWPLAWGGQNQRDILVALGYDVDIPWKDLSQEQRDWILYTEDRPTVGCYRNLTSAEVERARADGVPPAYQGTFIGARRYVLDTFATTKSAITKRRVSQFLAASPCATCHGKKLKPEALSVTFAGLDIAELSALPLEQLAALASEVTRPGWVPAEASWVSDTGAGRDGSSGGVDGGVDVAARLAAMEARVAAGGASHSAAPDVRRTANASQEKQAAAQTLAHELVERLAPMINLGLGYLSLDRSTPTLSGGERQRLRLATQLSSKLFGVAYVLDEPSAGLHPRDLEALIGLLHGLKDRGNSVFVVEHSLSVIPEADWLVDIGPGAGEHGGEVLYSGVPSGLAKVPESLTRGYLFPEQSVESRATREVRHPREWLKFEGVSRNNVRDVSVAIPVGCLTAVTGVSGAGKSSLVAQAIPTLMRERLGQKLVEVESVDEPDADVLQNDEPGEVAGRVNWSGSGLKRVVVIDQKPIGRTPRSNVATYTGLFDDVRKLFAATDEAKRRRYKAGRFSFNVAGGRCPTCEGEGSVMVELLFLPSVYSPCPTCRGSRYESSTLEVTWRGSSIADVLAMSVDEACDFFDGESSVQRTLQVLRDVGLGYVRLGQPATELSGGEAQRVKLASELQRASRGDTLYVLDEPTAGLHPADSDRLLRHLGGLVDAGNTVVMAELDMRVVAQADYVIDMGPGAGDSGGRVVCAGSPQEVSHDSSSVTAPYLAAYVSGVA